MKIEPMLPIKDDYEFKIDDVIVLKIVGSAIPVLGIAMPSSVYPVNIEEYYKKIMEQFNIEKMTNDLLSKKDKIDRISIDSEFCRMDGEIVFKTSDLEKYKIN